MEYELTPEEIAAIEAKENKRLDEWVQGLSKEEALAWMDAHIEDIGAYYSELEEYVDGLEALRWMRSHCGGIDHLEAVEIVRGKVSRTEAESKALKAWDKIKDKPEPNNPRFSK